MRKKLLDFTKFLILLTLSWMDNFTWIEHQKFCHLFPISNLTCCKCVALKESNLSHSFKNYYSDQTKHTPPGVLYGGSGFANKGETREGSPHSYPKF